ncbi:WD40-repeat-containing domain protein [Syncephalis plumigaleata]|nr:WD40-repeat-containing domain protein [Syncephalis plumigaleata]
MVSSTDHNMEVTAAVPDPDLIIRRSLQQTNKLFHNESILSLDANDSQRVKLTSKILDEYAQVQELPQVIAKKQGSTAPASTAKRVKVDATAEQAVSQITMLEDYDTIEKDGIQQTIDGLAVTKKSTRSSSNNNNALVIRGRDPMSSQFGSEGSGDSMIMRQPILKAVRPAWHPPWKLMRVISGHLGWVRCLAVEPGNKWFASGAGDRTIKIWDLASGTLKLSLTGHISSVRGLAVSNRHPYLFSAGEDKMVKCWDLEYNKVIRHYHGHLSGVYSLAVHPTLDVLVSAGRDAVARVWDMRTKQSIHVLTGHTNTVASVRTQAVDPQIITGSMDSTIRLWDLAAGKTMSILTHHKKSVRALELHPREFTFASGSADNIKQWKFPDGKFLQNFEGHNAIVNTLSVNEDGVMFSGADNGTMRFWDWNTGHCFQSSDAIVQPGSLESEAGIFTSTFDQSGLRLITGEADKTIKVWKEDETATEETHPLDWTPTLARKRY